MRFAVPHSLGREEVRRRMKARVGEIADHIPGGMAEVTSSWYDDDRMDLTIAALGHALSGRVEIEDQQVIYQFELPAGLGFAEPMVRTTIEKAGRKLLT
jgi:hypothetical protein